MCIRSILAITVILVLLFLPEAFANLIDLFPLFATPVVSVANFWCQTYLKIRRLGDILPSHPFHNY